MARTQILVHSRGKEQGLARRRTYRGLVLSAARANLASNIHALTSHPFLPQISSGSFN